MRPNKRSNCSIGDFLRSILVMLLCVRSGVAQQCGLNAATGSAPVFHVVTALPHRTGQCQSNQVESNFVQALAVSWDVGVAIASMPLSYGHLSDNQSCNRVTGAVVFYNRSAAGAWHPTDTDLRRVAIVSCSSRYSYGGSCVIGQSLAMDAGAHIAVLSAGSRSNSYNDGPSTEVAYVFAREVGGSRWFQEAVLHTSSASTPGPVLATQNGTIAFVGVYGSAGSVLVFQRQAGPVWSQVEVLTPTDGISKFGGSLAVNKAGNTLIVGVGNTQGNQYSYSTSLSSTSNGAYVFEKVGASWKQRVKLRSSDSQPGDAFGWSVALNLAGDIAAVGAPLNDGRGSVYIFRRGEDGSFWTMTTKVFAHDASSGDQFGFAIALTTPRDSTCDTMAISAIHTADDGPYSGSVYVFRSSRGGQWEQLSKVRGLQGSNHAFGRDVQLNPSGTEMLVGSYGDAYSVVDKSIATIPSTTGAPTPETTPTPSGAAPTSAPSPAAGATHATPSPSPAMPSDNASTTHVWAYITLGAVLATAVIGAVAYAIVRKRRKVVRMRVSRGAEEELHLTHLNPDESADVFISRVLQETESTLPVVDYMEIEQPDGRGVRLTRHTPLSDLSDTVDAIRIVLKQDSAASAAHESASDEDEKTDAASSPGPVQIDEHKQES